MFCGFNEKMVYGLGVFAEGLFEATLARAREQNADIETAFRTELADISQFLEALEAKNEELRGKHSLTETAREVVQWIAAHDRREPASKDGAPDAGAQH